MTPKARWPKDIVCWEDCGSDGQRRQCMTIPFTWLLPKAQRIIDAFPGVWLVGGPAVSLLPDYLQRCQIGREYPGVLQRVNPLATRTTVGCPNACSFCGVRTICGAFRELDVYPDRPIICDDNLLAASDRHVENVLHGLIQWGWCDFNQGIDACLLQDWHAAMIARIPQAIVRLALDGDSLRERWAEAVDVLLAAGVAKSRIRCYILCGFYGSPESDWRRCNFVEAFGVKALPMWFHRLDAMRYNEITPEQEAMGWSKAEQRRLMDWHYQHSGKRLTEAI